MKDLAAAHASEGVDWTKLAQEIKDLFSVNTGDYDPTAEEVGAIDRGLEHLLSQRPTPATPSKP